MSFSFVFVFLVLVSCCFPLRPNSLPLPYHLRQSARHFRLGCAFRSSLFKLFYFFETHVLALLALLLSCGLALALPAAAALALAAAVALALLIFLSSSFQPSISFHTSRCLHIHCPLLLAPEVRSSSFPSFVQLHHHFLLTRSLSKLSCYLQSNS